MMVDCEMVDCEMVDCEMGDDHKKYYISYYILQTCHLMIIYHLILSSVSRSTISSYLSHDLPSHFLSHNLPSHLSSCRLHRYQSDHTISWAGEIGDDGG